ncbi:MAG TPA: site-2 protease family protein [Candidatus Dormibacteraeota bacterium]|nr:site-2 protease family protein [Candidatus Dormibacteraeota bacterium]
MFSDPFGFIASAFFLIPGVAIAIPAHELAHGFAAYWSGDRSVRNRGFLSLRDPSRFFTVYGLAMMLFWKVGWGERIPVNEYRQESLVPKLVYALAGPAANLLLAVIFGFASRPLLLYVAPNTLRLSALGYLATILYAAYFANLAIFAFNLLPVPGFDGWRVVDALFRRTWPRFFTDVSFRQVQIQQVLILLLFVAQFFAGNLLNVLLVPFYAPAATLILGGCSGYYGLVPCLPSAGL